MALNFTRTIVIVELENIFDFFLDNTHIMTRPRVLHLSANAYRRSRGGDNVTGIEHGRSRVQSKHAFAAAQDPKQSNGSIEARPRTAG